MNQMSHNKTFRVENIVVAITYGASALAFLSVVKELGAVSTIGFGLLYGISLYLEHRDSFRVPRWLLTGLSVAIVGLATLRLNAQDLVTQILEVLVLLIAIKLLEKKRVRDHLQIYAMILLVLSGSGLLSLSITFVAYYVALILFLFVGAVLLTYYSEGSDLALSGRTIMKIVTRCLFIPLLAIPLTFLMFIILPRTQYPLLNFLNRPDKARTGFTDQVRLGAVSDIQEDSSIVLRATVEKVHERDLYWRGIVLDYFDGRHWIATRKQFTMNQAPGRFTGKGVKQTIYLEPYGNTYLFSLDRPVLITGHQTRRSEDFTYTSSGPVDTRLKYEALSFLGDTMVDDRPDRAKYLQIPRDLSSKIVALAQRFSASNPLETAMAALHHLKTGGFAYSMKNLQVTKSPLEDFLFWTKTGNCEYFATALAVILRINGIPSRLVGGYRGGYYNEVGGYYLVPQSSAHTWVEAYIEPTGWVRFDPTPTSSQSGIAATGRENLMKLTVLMDTFNYYWYVLVINYNVEKQFSMLMKIRSGLKRPGGSKIFSRGAWSMTGWLTLASSFLTLIGVLIFALKYGKTSREERVLRSFLRRMRQRGYPKRHSQGLKEFVDAISDEDTKRKAVLFVDHFQRLYFHDRSFTEGDLNFLKTIVRSL